MSEYSEQEGSDKTDAPAVKPHSVYAGSLLAPSSASAAAPAAAAAAAPAAPSLLGGDLGVEDGSMYSGSLLAASSAPPEAAAFSAAAPAAAPAVPSRRVRDRGVEYGSMYSGSLLPSMLRPVPASEGGQKAMDSEVEYSEAEISEAEYSEAEYSEESAEPQASAAKPQASVYSGSVKKETPERSVYSGSVVATVRVKPGREETPSEEAEQQSEYSGSRVLAPGSARAGRRPQTADEISAEYSGDLEKKSSADSEEDSESDASDESGEESSTDESVEFEAGKMYNSVFDGLVSGQQQSWTSAHRFSGSLEFGEARPVETLGDFVDLRIENNEIRIGGNYPPVNFSEIVLRRPKRDVQPLKFAINR